MCGANCTILLCTAACIITNGNFVFPWKLMEVVSHCNNGSVVTATMRWLYQFHLWDPICSNIILRGIQSSCLYMVVHPCTISSHIL